MSAANSQRVVSWCWNHRGRTRRTRHSCGNGTTRQRERRLIGERSAGTGTQAIGPEREQAAIGLLVEGGVIVADNLGPMFGDNPYLAWMQARPDFESRYVEGHVEYQTIEDGALVSHRLLRS